MGTVSWTTRYFTRVFPGRTTTVIPWAVWGPTQTAESGDISAVTDVLDLAVNINAFRCGSNSLVRDFSTFAVFLPMQRVDAGLFQ